jgi:hypothetical protein
VVTEIYNNIRGGTPAYLYQRSTGDTRISTALTADESPIFYAGTVEGVRGRTSLPYAAPDFTLEALPTAPGTYTGAAISSQTWLYVLERMWDGGGYQIFGLRSPTVPTTYPTLQDICDYFDKVASADDHTEATYGRGMLVEVWAYNGTDWKAVWLDAALTAATSLIGGFIADGVSPINNPDGHPGTLGPLYQYSWID